MPPTLNPALQAAVIAGASGAVVALLVARRLLQGGSAARQVQLAGEGADSQAPQSAPRLQTQASSMGDMQVCSSELVQKFVLTGGPCGGKTTALARLREFLEERGFRVFIAPEAATTLWSNGMSLQDLKCSEDGVAFQIKLMDMQMFFEDTFFALAERTGQRSVVICDRGTMDGKAYSSDEEWTQVVAAQGCAELELRDARYNAVMHLTSAANGAGKYYVSGPETPRMESPEAACALDERIRTAWLGHPRHVVLHNGEGGFEGKMGSLISEVSRLVGLPATGRKTRKFLLKPGGVTKPQLSTAGVESKTFTIEKCYPLYPGSSRDDGSEEHGFTYVRRRSSEEGFASYGETRVEKRDGEKIEMKRVLNSQEYARLMACADPARHVVRTARTCFIVGSLSVYIERFLTPHNGLEVLYVQAGSALNEAGSALLKQLPPVLQAAVEKEVTGDSHYSAYTLSLKGGPSSGFAPTSAARMRWQPARPASRP